MPPPAADLAFKMACTADSGMSGPGFPCSGISMAGKAVQSPGRPK